MSRKLVFIIILMFVLVSMFPVAFRVQLVEASGTIYIRADGSVDPPTANITSMDNITYTFTDNNYGRIIIQRDNIVVDGFGYTLEGTGFGNGLYLSGISNVTVKNVEIKEFDYGIYLYNSSNNAFYWNYIANNNDYGLYIHSSSNNTISENRITNNGGYSYTGETSVYVAYSSSNTISLNNITANTYLDGIELWSSSNNTIYGNNITNNYFGIRFLQSSNNNYVYENNITASNHEAIYMSSSTNNTLHDNLLNDNGYGFSVDGNELNHYLHTIDTSNLVNGKPVYYLINQNSLTVNPSTHPEIGFLAFINSTSIKVEAQNLTKNGQGLLFAYTNNSRITDNNITNNYDGLVLFSSFNNSIHRNNAMANDNQGIYFWGYSKGNNISENNIINNGYNGIYLSDSSNNTIYGNTIANNEYGIELYGSNNSLYLNNFVNNTDQVDSYNLVNFWDNGVDGNYWSDYDVTDSDHDGVGDVQYEIDSNNIDNYPLMGMFHSFSTSLGYNVHVISNSTIEDFEYFEVNSTIKMYVSNMTVTQTYGFCRICIPHTLMDVNNILVIIDDGLTPVLYGNYTLYDNGTHRWIYFAHEHSTHKVVIIPEFSTWASILLVLLALTVAIAIYKRRLPKTPIH